MVAGDIVIVLVRIDKGGKLAALYKSLIVYDDDRICNGKITTEKPDASDGVDPDFRAAMDEYEAFIDEYVTFIKKYEEEGKPASMLADYTKMMTQYSEFAAAMAEYESEELSDADAAYLIQVNARVQTKLLTLN